ncbi:hypothetical protein ACOMHN_053173 [Nucella lapillus]
MNSTFSVESPDTSGTNPKTSGMVLTAVENKTATRSSRTRLTDTLTGEETAQDTDKGGQRSKRSGEMAFKDQEEVTSKEAPKRKRTMYSTSSNSSYFGPLS